MRSSSKLVHLLLGFFRTAFACPTMIGNPANAIATKAGAVVRVVESGWIGATLVVESNLEEPPSLLQHVCLFFIHLYSIEQHRNHSFLPGYA